MFGYLYRSISERYSDLFWKSKRSSETRERHIETISRQITEIQIIEVQVSPKVSGLSKIHHRN